MQAACPGLGGVARLDSNSLLLLGSAVEATFFHRYRSACQANPLFLLELPNEDLHSSIGIRQLARQHTTFCTLAQPKTCFSAILAYFQMT